MDDGFGHFQPCGGCLPLQLTRNSFVCPPEPEPATTVGRVSHDHAHRMIFVISNAIQLREAISRLRFLENASKDSSLGRERDALELAVSRYLVLREPATS